MSRLILTPALVLKGRDPATDFDVDYSGESGELTIGCQTLTLKEWKRLGARTIASQMVDDPERCSDPGCRICPPPTKAGIRRQAAAVRKYLPRLQRLITTIEGAEAALKKSLRAQTKRT